MCYGYRLCLCFYDYVIRLSVYVCYGYRLCLCFYDFVIILSVYVCYGYRLCLWFYDYVIRLSVYVCYGYRLCLCFSDFVIRLSVYVCYGYRLCLCFYDYVIRLSVYVCYWYRLCICFQDFVIRLRTYCDSVARCFCLSPLIMCRSTPQFSCGTVALMVLCQFSDICGPQGYGFHPIKNLRNCDFDFVATFNSNFDNKALCESGVMWIIRFVTYLSIAFHIYLLIIINF